MRIDAAVARSTWALRGALRLLPRARLLRLRERWYASRFRDAARGFSLAAGRDHSCAYPPGINVVGYLHAESGVGEGARSTIRAALASGIPVSTIDFRTGCPSRMGERLPDRVPTGERYSVTLVHVNMDEVPTAFLELGRDFFERHYTIAFWNWELPEPPARWAPHASVFHEIWTPSSFVRSAVAKIAQVPVKAIPFCVELSTPPPATRRDLGLPGRGFVFLTMFDALSIAERKNPLAAWEAFRRAVAAAGVEACLVVKVVNAGSGHPVLERLREEARRSPELLLLEKSLDRPGVTALMAACDCFVSLHRAEGFGLPLLEAMALGKPVIATGWSGNLDFMTEGNSLLVQYRLQTLRETLGPYERGQAWANPDLDHAAFCMQRLMQDPDFARRIGAQAWQEAQATFTPAEVGARMRARLREAADPRV